MNCLALTGSDPVPLAVIAVTMIAAATALIVIARRARARRRAGVALTALAALTLTAGLSFTGAGGAQAATGDGCTTSTGAGTATPAGSDTSSTTTPGTTDTGTAGDDAKPTTPVEDPAPSTPSDPATPATPTDPTDPTDPALPVDPEPEPTPEDDPPVTPTAIDYVPSFASATQGQPYGLNAGDTVHFLTLTNVGTEDGADPIVLLVTDNTDGLWTVTGLLDGDRTVADDVSMTTVDGVHRFEIATPIAAGESRTFALTVHHPTYVSADGSTARPNTMLTVTISDEVTDADHSNNSASFTFIPVGAWGPPDDED